MVLTFPAISDFYGSIPKILILFNLTKLNVIHIDMNIGSAGGMTQVMASKNLYIKTSKLYPKTINLYNSAK